jgi:hypothetical protein
MDSLSSHQFNASQLDAINSTPFLNNSIYKNIDISQTFDFFYRWFVLPLKSKFVSNESTVVDCGKGFGWFSYAYLLAGGKKAIRVDVDQNVSKINLVKKYPFIIFSPALDWVTSHSG